MISEKSVTDKYLGIPYQHKGRTLAGLDCYGLIIAIYKDMGFELFDMDNYDKNWSFKGRNHLLENYHKQWVKLEKPLMMFDGLMLKGVKGSVNHGGLILSENRFIHCCKQGVIISDYSEKKWADKIDGFYHLKARNDNG